MFDYARISTMLRYEQDGCFPLTTRSGLLQKVKDIIRIVLNRGPIKRPYINTNEKHGKSGVFRFGTRGWEYPWVLEQLGIGAGRKLLDCGCGVSPILGVLRRRGFNVTGLDLFVNDEDYKRQNSGVPHSFRKKMGKDIEFLNGGMHDIPAEDNSFDVVTCISVMEHVVINTKNDPSYHLKCLDEMKRVLKPDGLLICTYDTLLDAESVFAGTDEWGLNGWYYGDDIEYVGLEPMDPKKRVQIRQEIESDEDTFFVPPDIYFQMGFGQGFNKSDTYHRLTSVGFALVK